MNVLAFLMIVVGAALFLKGALLAWAAGPLTQLGQSLLLGAYGLILIRVGLAGQRWTVYMSRPGNKS